MSSASSSDRPVPTSTPVLKKALKYGVLAAVVIASIGAILGGVFIGPPGVVGAVIGTAIAVVFLAITAASMLFANRFIQSEMYGPIFFTSVLGSWLFKFVVFVVTEMVLLGRDWVDPLVLFLSIVAQVLASLAVDVIVIVRSRMPHVSDVLPRADSSADPSERPEDTK